MYAHWPESVGFIKKCQFMELLSVSWPGFLRTGYAAPMGFQNLVLATSQRVDLGRLAVAF